MTCGTVALVGAYPPPVHGFALINQRLGERLAGRVERLQLLATSPRRGSGLGYRIEKLGLALKVIACLLRPRRGSSTVVIGLDGDQGIWLNLAQAAVAAARGDRIFLYHHSARCLSKPTIAVRLLTSRPLAGATHVMCNAAMIARFRDLYGWGGRAMIVSNLAYVDPPTAYRPREWPRSEVTLGFLSNLMRTKGVLVAVAVLHELLRRSVNARLLVAGPFVEPDVEAELRAAERALGGRMQLLGPVHGQAKARFFGETDIFLFPTEHPHETQSLVVPEALAAGVPTIAREHGYVREAVPVGWPGLVSADKEFAVTAADLITSWAAAPTIYDQLARSAQQHYRDQKAEADQQLGAFLASVLLAESPSKGRTAR